MSNIWVLGIAFLVFAALTVTGTIAYVLVRWRQTGSFRQALWELFGD